MLRGWYFNRPRKENIQTWLLRFILKKKKKNHSIISSGLFSISFPCSSGTSGGQVPVLLSTVCLIPSTCLINIFWDEKTNLVKITEQDEDQANIISTMDKGYGWALFYTHSSILNFSFHTAFILDMPMAFLKGFKSTVLSKLSLLYVSVTFGTYIWSNYSVHRILSIMLYFTHDSH